MCTALVSMETENVLQVGIALVRQVRQRQAVDAAAGRELERAKHSAKAACWP